MGRWAENFEIKIVIYENGRRYAWHGYLWRWLPNFGAKTFDEKKKTGEQRYKNIVIWYL